ncbi:serine/threonine-protein kinase rio2-like, partial [Pollicipes pollicipes]|uniref:serine/threonine-protein kinase rio2-like n=1 Tax=Pollicipes pollicipes TaxID=41117 RepID=UPI00188577DE
MGRLDVGTLRYMAKEDFRVLQGVEAGMRNHELVSTPLACSLANLRAGGAQKIIRQLQNNKLLAYERGRRYDGHRLTVSGYDFLALHNMVNGAWLDGFGNQIGTGKESDVYAVYDNHGEALALKFHRLGRTSFRKLKLLRDYHKNRSHMSWLYLSSLSAKKEFSYMKALHERGFPVPRPVHHNRHAVLMSIVEGAPLCELRELENPQRLYAECMELMIRLAECGVIHCDFNEFNLMVTDEERLVLIDFPQMVSTSHPNAEQLFQRDVDCLRRFFSRRFHFESDEFPVFAEVVRTDDLDAEIRASGYSHEFDEFDGIIGVGDAGEGSDAELAERRDASDGPEGSEDEDRFEDASDTPHGEEGVTEQPDTPASFPIDSSARVALSRSPHEGDTPGEGEDTAVAVENTPTGEDSSGEEDPPDGASSGGEDEETAAAQRRQLRRLKQQRLEQQRLEARSQLSEAIARSASQRSRSTAASTIAPELLQRR